MLLTKCKCSPFCIQYDLVNIIITVVDLIVNISIKKSINILFHLYLTFLICTIIQTVDIALQQPQNIKVLRKTFGLNEFR